MAAIGRVGIWTFQFELLSAGKLRDAAAELDELGFGALWFPEAVGREAFTQAGLLLGATRRIVIATGIASVWGRDPVTMAAAQKTLDEAYPGRFVLGMGISHAPLVEDVRGHAYRKPLAKMRAYLDAMDAVPYVAPPPSESTRVLGALAPKMLRLAAERTAGAHPYFVPPEHTTFARSVLGEGAILAPEQAVVFEKDPSRARAIAREHMATYLGLPNYRNNLKRLGFSEEEMADGGSDRLVDAIVAWGDMDAVLQRVRAHHDAGADHVCIQVLPADPTALPLQEWRDLAAALL